MARRIPTLVVVIALSGVAPALAIAAPLPDAGGESTAVPWFRPERSVNLGAVVLFSSMVLYMLVRARQGKRAYIRPISGLEAIDDAVGRAAELGRPVNFVPGLNDVSDPATAAALPILSRAAFRAARLRTRVLVPNFSAITHPVTRGILRDAFARAGRSDSFNPDDAVYFTSRHMTYTMAVVGMMAREKVAANFLIGHFFSESLILAETGAALGATQIGGCDSVSQLPFLITTCDYTLIGEELFAASAVISDDPMQRAVIAAHDIFKGAAAVTVLVAAMAAGLSQAGVDGARALVEAAIAFLRGGQ